MPDRAGNRHALTLGQPQLSELGHEVIGAHARNVRRIGESGRKDDRLGARTLARLARIAPLPNCGSGGKLGAQLNLIRATHTQVQ